MPTKPSSKTPAQSIAQKPMTDHERMRFEVRAKEFIEKGGDIMEMAQFFWAAGRSYETHNPPYGGLLGYGAYTPDSLDKLLKLAASTCNGYEQLPSHNVTYSVAGVPSYSSDPYPAFEFRFKVENLIHFVEQLKMGAHL